MPGKPLEDRAQIPGNRGERISRRPAIFVDRRIQPTLRRVGLFLIIEQREEVFATRFYDVGAIVYYLEAVTWEIPDFSVDRYFDRLVEIDSLIQSDGYVDIPFHQFFIKAGRE